MSSSTHYTLEHSSTNKLQSQLRSSTIGKMPKNIPWSQVFEAVPHSDYFKGLEEPSKINHITYFRHCSAPFAQKQHYHNLWKGTILPIIEGTTIQRVADQRARLNREWNAKAETDKFWNGVLNDELDGKARANNKRQITALREQAVDQLENTYEYYSKRTRILNSKDIESLQQHADLAEPQALGSDKTEHASKDKNPIQGVKGTESTSSSTDPTFNTDDLTDGSTDEDDVPVALSRLVGPGTLSSKLSRKSLYYKGNVCVSEKLMTYRRKQVEDESFLQDHQVNNILALNFIFHDNFLHDLRAAEKGRWECTLEQADMTLIMDIAIMCSIQERAEALKRLHKVAHERDVIMSPIVLSAQNLMATTALWADKLLVRDNEDSFIERFCKPFVNAFFGQFEDTRLCWSRDALKTGNQDTGERLYPDIMLCTTTSPGHAVFIGEIKKLDASEHECQRDRVKLFIQMKRSLDSLLDYGVDGPVIGILVQRHRVEIWSMTLPYEALYMPTHLGSFDLILSRYYFGALLALTPPLLAAKAAVEHTLTRLKEGPHTFFPKDWRRGTYHFEPIVLNDDVSMKKEAKALRQEANAMKPNTTQEADIENDEDKENRKK
ncbi:hypothetical protein BGZ73_008245 [Actinomortierella ambigua]|nr:hypothetical protein BGZ73_008245 [Actinomortierella ambigua]